MFVDRTRRDEDPWLQFKIWAFVLGAAFAIAGIYFRRNWLITVAIVILVVGYAARFFERFRVGGGEEGESVAEEESVAAEESVSAEEGVARESEL